MCPATERPPVDTLVVTTPTSALRKLYFTRFAFAVVWAGLLFATADALTPLSATLLVLYPLFDVACAVVDVRSARTHDGPVRHLYLNIVLSTLTGVGLAVAATSGIPAVLRVWGVWAVTAGIVQLLVGALRRRMGGQWAMIASGAISTVAGASFFAQAGTPDASLGNLAGYALLGGIFFLVAALRLDRAAR
ncbi:membrane protein [Streptomyces sp. AS58]|nr:membrane protein [Streptomyces sp. AS58]